MEWDGRVVLVTGGSRGIGLATAKTFLDAGASVVVTGRDESALAVAIARLDGAGQVRSAKADVSSVSAAGQRSPPPWMPSAGSTSSSPMPAATSQRRSPR